MMEHVGQKQGERLVADDLASAPHGMAEPERRLLPGEARLAGTRQLLLQERELVLLAAFGERALELELAVEMVLDDALVAARHEDEMLDAGGLSLIDHMLDDRPVDHGQHFLRDRLGGRQKPGAETGDRKYGFADGSDRVGHERSSKA